MSLINNFDFVARIKVTYYATVDPEIQGDDYSGILSLWREKFKFFAEDLVCEKKNLG